MDRNLGAKDTNSSNVTFTGTKYQFGRKDPFPTVNTVYDYKGNKKSVISVVWNSIQTDLPYSVKNPNIYSIRTNEPYDWCYYEHPYKNAIWRNPDKWYHSPNEKSLFDPCPVGWKVPKSSTFNGIAQKAKSLSLDTGISLSINNISIGSEMAWFPFSGCWTAGTVFSSGFCITRYSDSGRWLRLDKSSIDCNSNFASSGLSYGDAVAGAIRCVQE